jgi:dihydroneopterin aldolase
VNAVTVVKIGGSYALSTRLRDWLEVVASCAGSVVVVPGGGPFADVVRALQPKLGFDDRAAHRMALLAMEQYGCAIASLRPELALAESVSAIRHLLRDGRVPVWTPVPMALEAEDIPCSWEVTADSLAAWLAGRLRAERLLLVKQGVLPAGRVNAQELAARGIVDAAFPRFLGMSPLDAAIAAPEDYTATAAAIRQGQLPGVRIDLP